MFALLSDQKQLLKQLTTYKPAEIKRATVNLTLVITALQFDAKVLLSTRREHGVLIVAENLQGTAKDMTQATEPTEDNNTALNLPSLLLNQAQLIKTINTFCLTEAIIIRNSFINCLDELAEQGLVSLSTDDNKESKEQRNVQSLEKITEPSLAKATEPSLVKATEPNNVSPIRLTQIKQKLAKAVQESSDKNTAIKNKLNSLLSSPKQSTPNVNKSA